MLKLWCRLFHGLQLSKVMSDRMYILEEFFPRLRGYRVIYYCPICGHLLFIKKISYSPRLKTF